MPSRANKASRREIGRLHHRSMIAYVGTRQAIREYVELAIRLG